MVYRKFSLWLFLLSAALFPVQASAGSLNLEFAPVSGNIGLAYAFAMPDAEFALVEYRTPWETGKTVVYGAGGQFEGVLPLQLSQAGGKTTVTVSDLKLETYAKEQIELPAAPGYVAPQGSTHVRVSGFSLQESAEGFSYAFSAPGADYLTLTYQNMQQSGQMTVRPLNTAGDFAGSVSLPLTYARSKTTVQIIAGSGVIAAEGQVRKGYEAPPAPEERSGRLSGVTVCIDPGHQENGVPVMEPLGPGLEGRTSGSGGMAQGRFTGRKESIVVLEAGMALRDELIRQGARVVMTRERQDQFLTNQQRCQAAADGGADVMLRLHCDTRENSRTRGISIYAPLHSDYARAVGDAQEYRAMGNLLLNAMKRSTGYALSEKTGFVTLSDQFVGNNWAQMPCFLIEMGFLSNQEEDYLLSTPVYQQRLAEGMAQGVYEIALHRGWIIGE